MSKRILCALAALLCLFALCSCGKVEEMSSLYEISRPYTGEYVCERLLLGGEEYTEKFDYIKLKLGYNGKFTLTYRDAEGREGSFRGDYEMKETGDEITFTARTGLRSVSRTFPVENGAILMDLTLGQKLLHAEFRFP